MRDLTLVFDLDGTLVDTAPDLIAALNVALALDGIPPLTVDDARDLIGAGARALLERGIAVHGASVAPERVEVMFDLLLAHYTGHIADASRPFDGVERTLRRFSAEGARLAVCTNKREDLARLLLDRLEMSHFFSAICGGDTFPVRKPDAGHLTGTIEQAGGQPSRAVMIGDSATDLKAARAAGIPVVLVDFGYTEIPARDLGGDALISHFDELADALRQLRVI